MKRCVLLTLLIVLGAGLARADRGSIPFDPEVLVFEPSQRAIIGWNGMEEVLILTTDLYSSQPTKVLEVLPLPAEPEVTESDVQVFEDLTEIINSHLRAWSDNGDSRSQGVESLAEAPAPAAEVTFHEQIGAHDITVFKVLDQARFVAWVEAYLAEQNAEAVTVPEPLKQSWASTWRMDMAGSCSTWSAWTASRSPTRPSSTVSNPSSCITPCASRAPSRATPPWT